MMFRKSVNRQSALPASNTSRKCPKFYEDNPSYCIETFGGPIPITVNDNLTKAPPFSGLIDATSEHVLFTVGKNMYLWNLKQDSLHMKKFSFPPSEIPVLGRHVAITVFPRTKSLTCVTPTGILRYWKSITNPNGSVEIQLPLKEQEAHCVLQVTYEKILVASRQCTLYFIDTSNKLMCKEFNLKESKSSLASKLASYFYSTNHPADEMEQIRRVLVPVQAEEFVFVISNCTIYCVSFFEDKVLWNVNFVEAFGHEVVSRCFDEDIDNLPKNKYQVHILDGRYWSDESELILFVGCRIVHDTDELHNYKFAFALLQRDSPKSDMRNFQVTIFPTKMVLPLSDTSGASLLNESNRFELEIPSPKFCDALLRSRNRIVHVSSMLMIDDVEITSIDLSLTNDVILSCGVYDDNVLLLTAKKGLVSYRNKCTKHLREFQSLSAIQQALKSISEEFVTEPEEQLKQIFLLHIKGTTTESQFLTIVQNEVSKLLSDKDVDSIVFNCALLLSDEELLSEVPNYAAAKGKHQKLLDVPILIAQKLDILGQFIDFVFDSKIVQNLSTIDLGAQSVKGTTPTLVAIHKILENVACQQRFYILHCNYNDFFESFIRIAMERRGSVVLPNDFMLKFYRNGSKFDEIFELISNAQSGGDVNATAENGLILSQLFKDVFDTTSEIRRNCKIPIGNGFEFCHWNLTDSFLEHVITHFIWFKQNADVLCNKTTTLELVQSYYDLAVSCLTAISLCLSSVENCDENNEMNLLSIETKSTRMRTFFIEFFMEIDHRVFAVSLAEKFLDFKLLIRHCFEDNNLTKLKDYQREYAQSEFDNYLIQYLYDSQQYKLLLCLESPALMPFVNNIPELRWIVEAKNGQWYEAAHTLFSLARSRSFNYNPSISLQKKRQWLSYAKLYALIAQRTEGTNNSDNLQNLLPTIQKMIKVCEIQLNLSHDVKLKYQMQDANQSQPLPPLKLIELLMESLSSQYASANEYNQNVETQQITAFAALYLLDEIDDSLLMKKAHVEIWRQICRATDWSRVDINNPNFTEQQIHELLFMQLLINYNQNKIVHPRIDLECCMEIIDRLDSEEEFFGGEFLESVKVIVAACFQAVVAFDNID